MRRFRFRSSGAAFWPGARACAVGAVLGAAATLMPVPASAQWFGPGPWWGPARPYGMRPAPLPPGAIYAGLQRRGLRPLGRPRFTGAEYVVDAVNPRGDQVRLVIDAFDGEILDRTQTASAMIPPRNVGPGISPAPGPYAPPEMAPPEAAPRKKTARVEPSRGPKPSKALPASRAPAADAAPAVSPAAPPPVVQTEAPAAPAPATIASVPAPALDPAPAAVPEPRAAPTPEPSRAAEAPAAEPAQPQQKSVRVIQGVTAVPAAGGEPAKSGTWTEPPSAAPAQ
jgi:hypothetical protein